MRDAGTMVMNGCLTARLPNPRVVAGQDMSRPNSAYLVETNPSTHLKWSTFVTPSIPVVTTDFAPGEHERPWPPTSSTLIYGLREAVLVDSFITLEQPRAQADWIASTGEKSHNYLCDSRPRRSLLRGEHSFGALPKSALRCRAQCDPSNEGAKLTGVCGEVLGIAFPASTAQAYCGCRGAQDESY